MTFQSFMVRRGDTTTLPRRYANNLEPLVAFLDDFIFANNGAQLEAAHDKVPDELKGGAHNHFRGQDAVIPNALLAEKLGADFSKKFHMKDWTEALEATFYNRGILFGMDYGDNYRIIFNCNDKEGATGVYVAVCESLINRAKSQRQSGISR